MKSLLKKISILTLTFTLLTSPAATAFAADSDHAVSSTAQLTESPSYSQSNSTLSYNPNESKLSLFGTWYRVKATSLHVRDRRSTKGNIIATLAHGTKIKVSNIVGVWGKVSIGGKTGYVNMNYLQLA